MLSHLPHPMLGKIRSRSLRLVNSGCKEITWDWRLLGKYGIAVFLLMHSFFFLCFTDSYFLWLCSNSSDGLLDLLGNGVKPRGVPLDKRVTSFPLVYQGSMITKQYFNYRTLGLPLYLLIEQTQRHPDIAPKWPFALENWNLFGYEWNARVEKLSPSHFLGSPGSWGNSRWPLAPGFHVCCHLFLFSRISGDGQVACQTLAFEYQVVPR